MESIEATAPSPKADVAAESRFVLQIQGDFIGELADDVRTSIGTVSLRCSIADCERPIEQVVLQKERALSSLASLIDAHVERHWDEHHRVMVPPPGT